MLSEADTYLLCDLGCDPREPSRKATALRKADACPWCHLCCDPPGSFCKTIAHSTPSLVRRIRAHGVISVAILASLSAKRLRLQWVPRGPSTRFTRRMDTWSWCHLRCDPCESFRKAIAFQRVPRGHPTWATCDPQNPQLHPKARILFY